MTKPKEAMHSRLYINLPMVLLKKVFAFLMVLYLISEGLLSMFWEIFNKARIASPHASGGLDLAKPSNALVIGKWVIPTSNAIESASRGRPTPGSTSTRELTTPTISKLPVRFLIACFH
jgi:hypothetical protein